MAASSRKSRTGRTRAASSTAAARCILVTGATGFVGGHLVRALRRSGLRVRALVRDPSRAHGAGLTPEEVVRGDLTEPASIAGICDGVDGVIHAACAVARTFDSGRTARADFHRVNVDGTVNLAREVLRRRGLRMVHLSSTAAMGAPIDRVVDEQSPCRPTTPYQVSKREAELALLDLHDREGLDVVLLRSCLVAGEGKDGSELETLFRLARRGLVPYIGTNLDVQKPLILVDDLVQALLLALDRGPSGATYLVTSGGHHTMREILTEVGRLVGRRRVHLSLPVPIARAAATAFDLARRLRPDWNPPLTHQRVDLFLADRAIDISRARRELGYAPAHQDLAEMLGRTWRDLVARGRIRE